MISNALEHGFPALWTVWEASVAGKVGLLAIVLMAAFILFTMAGSIFEQAFLQLEGGVLSVLRTCATTLERPYPKHLQRRQLGTLVEQWSRSESWLQPDDEYIIAKMRETVVPDPALRELTKLEQRLLALGCARIIARPNRSAKKGREFVEQVEEISKLLSTRARKKPKKKNG